MVVKYRDGAVPAVSGLDLGADFAPLADEVAASIDRGELTQALEAIWQRVRRLNRYVEEQAPWKLAKDEAQADHLRVVLRSLAEGLRTVTVLLHPYLPESVDKLLDALGETGEERLSLEVAAFGAGAPGGTIGDLAPLFPKPQ
jgi:methionyl-tRNA synthetase